MLAEEDGPWDLIVRLRKGMGDAFPGNLFDCFHCLSLWLSLPPTILLWGGWAMRLVYWLALSRVACLLKRATARQQSAAPTIQFSEGDTP